MLGRVLHRVKRTTNFIPAGDTFFSSPFCCALFQSRKLCRTFFISAIDFCLQDSVIIYIVLVETANITLLAPSTSWI